ncbi:MAG: glycosyltransferase family 39 protein [Azoarcus sp.]|nr:glycosyltransferase family 39 protein [Azoarcus sp.]
MPSDPYTPSLLHRRIYGTVGLTLLVGLYLLTGLTGHEPWRGDDARYFGPVFSMLQGEGLLFPAIGGLPFPDYPPLYYWVAALLATLTGSLLPPHDGARLASALFTALAVYWIARAAERLYGRPARTPAALLTLGSLGLVLHAHETQPLIALMAMVALVLNGLSRVPQQPVGGSLQAALGSALALLAGGLPGAILTLPLFLLVMTSCPDCRNPRASGALLAGLSIAAALSVLWPLAVHLSQPELLSLWLHTEWNDLTQHGLSAEEIPRLIELLSWFTWPLWPIAIWALWRGRRQILTLRWLLPLLSAALALALIVVGGDLSPPAALPLLPAVALLAAGGAPSLRRGAANAFDWFAVMTFGVIAILVWIAWTAQAYAWPPGLARHIARVTPSFTPTDTLLQPLIGIGICLIWLALVWRLPRTTTRAAANWAMGMTMLWCLAVVLLMPWFDYGRSYRPAVSSLQAALVPHKAECIASTGLPDAVRSALDYYAGIRPAFTSDGTTPCRLLLTYADRKPGAPDPAEGWHTAWEFRRGGGKQLEVFRLYLRSDPD